MVEIVFDHVPYHPLAREPVILSIASTLEVVLQVGWCPASKRILDQLPCCVNVPPVSDRRLLRSCLRWTRPAQKVLESAIQDIFGRVGIPVKLTPTFARMPAL